MFSGLWAGLLEAYLEVQGVYLPIVAVLINRNHSVLDKYNDAINNHKKGLISGAISTVIIG